MTVFILEIGAEGTEKLAGKRGVRRRALPCLPLFLRPLFASNLVRTDTSPFDFQFFKTVP